MQVEYDIENTTKIGARSKKKDCTTIIGKDIAYWWWIYFSDETFSFEKIIEYILV